MSSSPPPSGPPYADPARGLEAPSTVDTAVMIMWLRIGLQVLIAVLTLAMLDTTIDDAVESQPPGSVVRSENFEEITRIIAIGGVVVFLVVGVVIAMVLLVYVRRGAGWARVVYTVLTVLGILGSLFGFLQPQPMILTLLALVYMLLSAASVVLLWQKDANAWFARPA